MKTLLALFGILFTFSSALAAQNLPEIRKAFFEKLEGCGQAVYSDTNWFVASLPNTANGIGHIRIQSLLDPQKSLDLPANDTVVDVKIRDGQVFVLTETTLEAWDIASAKSLFKYATHPNVGKGSHWNLKATGFVLKGDQALIAHGTLGIEALNLKTGAIDKMIPMLSESSAQDIAFVNDTTAVVAVDDQAEAAFRGLYVLDLNSMTVSKQIPIDNALPYSVRVTPQGLLVGYINAIWKFDLNQTLNSRGEAQPLHRSFIFPGLANVDIRGKTFYDETYMYSCFYHPNGDSGDMGAYPKVFKLTDLGL